MPFRKSKQTATQARDPLDEEPVKRAMDFKRYVPSVISRVATKMTLSAQAYFQEHFGVTLLEWRIVSFIVAEGPSSAYDIWTAGNMDKAAVSRALKALSSKNLVSIRDVPRSARRRTVVTLTKSGRRLHDELFDEITTRHERLVAGLTRSQIENLIAALEHLEGRIALMDKPSDQQPTGFDPTKVLSRS